MKKREKERERKREFMKKPYVLFKYQKRVTKEQHLSNVWHSALTHEGFVAYGPITVYRRTKTKPRTVKRWL